MLSKVSSRLVAGAPILTQGTDRTGGAAYTLVSPISYQVRRSSISSFFSFGSIPLYGIVERKTGLNNKTHSITFHSNKNETSYVQDTYHTE